MRGAAAGMVSVAGMGVLSACNNEVSETSAAVTGETEKKADRAETYTYADTIAWDGQYDVVVVGFGAAGATAAHYAARNGAQVLICDAAPKGHEGGNSRYAQQFMVFGEDKEGMRKYYAALSGGMETDQEVIDTFIEKSLTLPELFAEDYGATEVMKWKGNPAVAWAIPEFPELEGGDSINALTVHKGASDGALWKLLRAKVVELKDRIDIWYRSRANQLIQDPETRTILGVKIERNGEMVNIRANNGVVMTCGGFENNPKYVQTYLGVARHNACGTLYNRGDGIEMCLQAGADLWHMSCYESTNRFGGLGIESEIGERGVNTPASFMTGSCLVLGANGKRYVNESHTARHGHVYYNGEYHIPNHSYRSWFVMDQKKYDEEEAAGHLSADIKSRMIVAESIEELADKTGMDAVLLARSIQNFNSFAVNQDDLELDRAPESMEPLTGEVYYAVPLTHQVLNTQGGARRNARAEIVDAKGNPIPHLYSAGEFGGLTANSYQGATNLSECVIFGKIAGENAAAQKEALPIYDKKAKVESKMIYTAGCSDEKEEEYELEENEYVGIGSGIGGDVVVAVKYENGAIQNVRILVHNETEKISDPAIGNMPGRFVGLTSAGEVSEVDIVSGASMTSKALKAAVANALEQVQ